MDNNYPSAILGSSHGTGTGLKLTNTSTLVFAGKTSKK